MKNKILYNILLISTLLVGSQMPPMPPMIPSIDTKKSVKSTMPKSCELIPPMVIFLPPPMEAELVKCKNNLHKPKKEFVEQQLSKLLRKNIKDKKIEIVKKFNQLYKVTYNGGVILVNKNVDAFIRQ